MSNELGFNSKNKRKNQAAWNQLEPKKAGLWFELNNFEYLSSDIISALIEDT